jgi:hypothetical protein
MAAHNLNFTRFSSSKIEYAVVLTRRTHADSSDTSGRDVFNLALPNVRRNESLMYDPAQGCWYHFRRPAQVLTTGRVGEVLKVFQALDLALAGDECYAAGFVSYEAAPGLDPALKVRPGFGFPLVWFGLYPARMITGTILEAASTHSSDTPEPFGQTRGV